MALIQRAGFIDSELVGETGFNSSPVTKGMLLRAKKPIISSHQERRKPVH